MALEPAAMIQGLADGDAVEPGLQRTALAETANSFEGFQENFLRGVGGIRGVSQHAENQIVDRTVVMVDEPVERRLRAGLQLGDKFGLIPAPRESAGPIGHGLPFFAYAELRLRRTGLIRLGWTPQPTSALSIRHRRERKCFRRCLTREGPKSDCGTESLGVQWAVGMGGSERGAEEEA